MARLLEIEGLADMIREFRSNMTDVREHATDINHHGKMLRDELKDLSEQLQDHRQELKFEASSMGNSPGVKSTTSREKSILAGIAADLDAGEAPAAEFAATHQPGSTIASSEPGV